MSRYVYAGSSTNLNRFGQITTGQIVDLTDAEVLSIAGNANFFPEPARGQREIKITSNTALTDGDTAKRVICNHSSAVTVTLPANPSIGDKYEIFHGQNSSGDDITIEPNGKPIDSGLYRVAGLVITSGGTGFHANDVLTVAGGTHTTAATITVLTVNGGGVILTASVTVKGRYSVKATNPVSVTGGFGTSASLTLTWEDAPIIVTAAGDSAGLYWNGIGWISY